MPNIIKFPELDSTNLYVLKNIAELEHGDVILADSQTAGRGRLGRVWFSPAGKNLYFTIVLKDNLSAKIPVHFYTILASLAVLKALRNYKIKPNLKWPNDVLVNGRKICGILAEANKQGLAVGIGLNVNMNKSELDKIDKPATSLLLESGAEQNRDKLLENILTNFFEYLKKDTKESFREWRKEIDLINKKVTVTDAGKITKGIVRDVTDEGLLLVDTGKGVVKVMSGDVSF